MRFVPMQLFAPRHRYSTMGSAVLFGLGSLLAIASPCSTSL
jgi:hypothetical protein